MPNNTTVGVRKSQFTAATAISGTATFDFVENGTNIKITFADLIPLLGATGTIVQVGDSGGTPVLDPQGATNGIRNLVEGDGISLSITAQNGVEISTALTFDTTGEALVTNPAAQNPNFKSLVQGSGMLFTATDGTIEIGLDPEELLSVIVNDVSDFPAPIGGVITLAASTDYIVVSDVSSTNRFILSNDTLLRAVDSTQARLTYTGTGDMFTASGVRSKVTMLELDCPSARLFNIDTSLFQFVTATVISCDSIALFTDMPALQFNDIGFVSVISGGMSFVGSNGIFVSQTETATIAAGSYLDLGTATFTTFSYGPAQVQLNGTSVFLEGATGSANINAGSLGVVFNTRTLGPGTPLSGISTDDAQWQFALNDSIADTRPDGLLSLQGNLTETVITAASTDGTNAVLVAGTWVIETTSQMTGTAAGRLTYNGSKDAKLPITTTIAVEPASGVNVSISAYVVIDGTVVVNSRGISTASAGQPTSLTLPWQHVFSTNSFVEIFVENRDNTTNLLVSSAKSRTN